MHAPITVNYTPDGDDWTVTVRRRRRGPTRSAKAAGLIAARDQPISSSPRSTGRRPPQV